MNDKELQENIKTRFELLPMDVKDLLMSNEIESRITSLAKENGLSENQRGRLFLEIFLVLLGVEPYFDFKKNLSAISGLAQDKIDLINRSVSNSVFSLVTESLETMRLAAGSSELIEPDQIPQKETQYQGLDNYNPTAINRVKESREDILNTIENPVPANLPTGDLKPIEIPEKNQVTSTINGVPNYGKQDPYREPLI